MQQQPIAKSVALDLYAPSLNFRVKGQGKFHQTLPAPPPMTLWGFASRKMGSDSMVNNPAKGEVYVNALMRSTKVIMRNAFFNEPKLDAGGTEKAGTKHANIVQTSFGTDWMFENELTVLFAFTNAMDFVLFWKGLCEPGQQSRLGRSENEISITGHHLDVPVEDRDKFERVWVPDRVSVASFTAEEFQEFKFGTLNARKVDRYNLSSGFDYQSDGLARIEKSSATYDYPHAIAKSQSDMRCAVVHGMALPLIRVS